MKWTITKKLFDLNRWLTLKWSRGSLRTLKSAFVRQRKKHWQTVPTLPFLNFYMLTIPHLLTRVWKKNLAARCAAFALGFLGTPYWPQTGGYLTKIIFHIDVTFEFWWLYLNAIIYLLICNHIHTPLFCTNEWRKFAVGKVLESTEMNKASHFLFGIFLFYLFLRGMHP